MPSMAKTGSTNRSRTNKLLRISVSQHYHASSRELWRFLTDTTLWPMWGPTVLAVRCSERFIRKGSIGKVRTPIGVWVPFVITEYDDLHFWAWKVAGIRATGHRVIRANANLARLLGSN